MRKSLSLGLLILLGAVSMALSGTASADNVNLSINGKVMEKGTRTPIAGALISIREAESMTAITDEVRILLNVNSDSART